MKKVNLLSKREMKKVTGGDPGPGGICVPTIHCVNSSLTEVLSIPVPDCDVQTPAQACYAILDPMLVEFNIGYSYCSAC